MSGSILDANVKNDKVVYTRIPKYGVYPYTNGALSSRFTIFNNDLIFFYNDDKDNLKRELSEKPNALTNPKDAVLVAAIVKPDGSLTRQLVMDYEDNFTTSIFSIQVINSSKILLSLEKFQGMGSQKSKFGVITIRD
jgi:hypothetical protein